MIIMNTPILITYLDAAINVSKSSPIELPLVQTHEFTSDLAIPADYNFTFEFRVCNHQVSFIYF